MKVVKKYFNNKVILFKYDSYFDNRGSFSETYNKKNLNIYGINDNFVQDNQSISKKIYTFRGIHLQLKPFTQVKLLRVVSGEIIDYIVDLRKNSKNFGNKISIKMNHKDNYILYIPKDFGHGFLTLKENTIINYKVSNFYSPQYAKTIIYKDKDINLNIKENILKRITISNNDKKGISLKDFKKEIGYKL